MLKCNATVSCNTKQYHTTNKCNNFICHMSERPQTSSFSEADFWKSLMTIRPLWSPNLLHCTIFIKDLLIPSKNTLFFEAAFWRRSTIWSLLQSSLYYLLAQSHHSHWCWASQFSSFTTFVKNYFLSSTVDTCWFSENLTTIRNLWSLRRLHPKLAHCPVPLKDLLSERKNEKI